MGPVADSDSIGMSYTYHHRPPDVWWALGVNEVELLSEPPYRRSFHNGEAS